MKTTNTIIDVTTDRSICSNAGTLLIADTANALGVTEILDQQLARFTPDTVTHTSGMVLTSMAVALTAGATCLDDLDLLKPLVDTGLTRAIGSVTTAHRRVHQLADHADSVDMDMSPGDAHHPYPRLERTRAPQPDEDRDQGRSDDHRHRCLPDPHPLEQTRRRTETYKGGYGFHPLCAFVDHGPGLGGEPLSLLMRPGNKTANNADDHITVIRNTYRTLPESERGGNIGHKILVRTDGAGGTKKVATYLHSRGFAYSLGIRVNDKIGTLVSTLPEHVKQGVLRPGADGGGTDTETLRMSRTSAACWPQARPGSTASTWISSLPGFG
ncbi:transposase [Corynebacterium variabile]|uniref:transposase n=1 Tax=Corynebacterium variabile TaxID=1727 RepID=UPI003FD2A493